VQDAQYTVGCALPTEAISDLCPGRRSASVLIH
jgi:hypothetical protein